MRTHTWAQQRIVSLADHNQQGFLKKAFCEEYCSLIILATMARRNGEIFSSETVAISYIYPIKTYHNAKEPTICANGQIQRRLPQTHSCDREQRHQKARCLSNVLATTFSKPVAQCRGEQNDQKERLTYVAEAPEETRMRLMKADAKPSDHDLVPCTNAVKDSAKATTKHRRHQYRRSW